MRRELGAAATAYYGGRSETRIRGVPMPVRYVDFTSMYPTVFALLGLWRWVTARRFVIADATAMTRAILDQVDRVALHDPGVWPGLAMVFCRVQPCGDLLPVRARYTSDAGAWTIGINRLHSDIGLWYTLADLVASRRLGGSTPEILAAFRIEPAGILPGLRPVLLRGSVPADPSDDLFRLAIEERQRLRRTGGREYDSTFLKTFANGGAYGVFAEYRVGEPVGGGVRVEAYGLWPIEARVRTPEEPGEFSFPPLAATITGGARLLLALLQADIEARGGTFLACDTDSLLVVATPSGGLIACPGGPGRLPHGQAAVLALSHADLDAALDEIETLNPYAPGLTRLVKLEEENFAADGSGTPVGLRALAISPKRYVLYEHLPDGPLIRKPSEHGLGMYRQPTPNPPGWDKKWPAWIEHIWESIIREAEGLPALPEPGWYDRPALSQLSITSPRLLAPFRTFNAGVPYRDQVKPFGFMLVGHVDPLVPLPSGMSLSQLMPVAPYTSKPEEFQRLSWVNRANGARIEVTTRPEGEPGKVRLKTYREVMIEYRLHPDVKSGDPHGGQGHRGSRGLLPRLHVEVGEVVHIGKESNHLDEETEGELLERDQAYVEYRDQRQEWHVLLPQLRRMRAALGPKRLQESAGLSERALRDALNLGRLPRRRARAALLGLLRGSDEGLSV